MASSLGERLHVLPPPAPQGEKPPSNLEIPAGTDRDEEMHSDSEPERGAPPAAEELEGQAFKRKRTERDEYTCSWDKDARSRSVPAPVPPADFHEWVRLYADKSPFNPEYDEAIYARLPTYRYANPHFCKTQRGTPEEMPLDDHDAFTPGPFPHTHISDWRHTGNIQQQQKDMLMENHERILALVPHGGGRAYTKQGAVLAKAYEKCLRSIRFKGYDGDGCDLKVIPPDARNEGSENSTNQFAQPWDFYVLLKDDTALLLRMFLIWQEHFAFDQSRSFSIYPLVTDDPESWKLLLLICPDVDWASISHNNVLDKRSAILNVVKAKLKSYSPYRDEIATLAATKIGHTGTRDQVFKTITDSFHLEPASADTKGGPVSVFILLARPLTRIPTELKKLKGMMIDGLCGNARGAHFYVGTSKISVVDDTASNATISVDCKLCKSDMHRTADCPLPKTRGWRGITAAALGRDDKPDDEKAVGGAKEDPNEVINDVLSSIRGEPKASGSSKPRKAKGKSGGNGWKNRGQGGQGGGKGKGPART